MDPNLKRRWFQFGVSIRDLLWLTVFVVVLAVGWWVQRDRDEHQWFYDVVHDLVAPHYPERKQD